MPWLFNYAVIPSLCIIAVHSWLHHTPSSSTCPTLLTVDRRINLSLHEFTDIYDGKWPIIISDIVPSWPAYRMWSEQYLCDNYATSQVTMRTTYGSPPISEGARVPLSTFCHLLHHDGHTQGEWSDQWSYIEDETFLHRHPRLMQHILTPVYTLYDLFPLLPPHLTPWSHMLLWGTPGSRSPLHIDPYNWTAVSSLIHGRKEWKLFPPGQDDYLYVITGARCGLPLDCIKYNSGVDMFSDASIASHPLSQRAHYIHVTQYPGDMIIIPTGWFHQAYNPVVSLSVSSEVMSPGNVRHVVGEMVRSGSLPPHLVPRPLLHEDMRGVSQDHVTHMVREVFRSIPQDVVRQGALIKRQTLAAT